MNEIFSACSPDVTYAAIRGDMFSAKFCSGFLTFSSIVGSTGNKNYVFNIFGNSVTYVINHATTGTFYLGMGFVLRKKIGGTSELILFPPTYIDKSAGTAPTNGILSTEAEVVDLGNIMPTYTNIFEVPITTENPLQGRMIVGTNSNKRYQCFLLDFAAEIDSEASIGTTLYVSSRETKKLRVSDWKRFQFSTNFNITLFATGRQTNNGQGLVSHQVEVNP